MNLFVSSKERSSGTSTNFTLQFPQTFPPCEAIELKAISIPYSYYNVRSTNNSIVFTENATQKTATFVVGSYSGATLASALKTALDLASGGYATFTVTFDSQTFKFTIASTQLFVLNFPLSVDAYILLGFNFANTTSAVTTTSPNAAILSSPNILNLVIREFSESLYCATRIIDTTFLLLLKDGSGVVNTWEPYSPVVTRRSTNAFSRLTVQLTDMEGNIVDLNNADIDFHIKIYPKEVVSHGKRHRIED